MALLWLLPIWILAFGLLVARRMARKLQVLDAQLAAYRRGDYYGQLQIIEGFRTRGSEPRHYLFFRGAACFELGRLGEAEQLIRRSLSLETRPAEKTICRDQLGRVLMQQERWDEAAACFRECIAESPRRGGGYYAMAELLLRRDEQPEAALAAARSAVAAERAEKPSRDRLGKESHNLNLAESLAVLAWALARNHADPAEVENALNEAFAACGQAAKPILAQLHFYAGRACALLGDAAGSASHFQSAADLDPLGNYGRLAQSVWATSHPQA